MESNIIEPGISKSVDLNFSGKGKKPFSYQQKQIIEKFSSVFRIVFANTRTFKTAKIIKNGEEKVVRPNYAYCIAKPTNQFTEQWGIEQGILVVVKLIGDFDEKNDLDFIDNLYNEYQNRLDRLLTIFVSDDSEVKSKIRGSTFLNDKERKVVLPFSKDELDKANFRGVVEDKLIEFFTQRDLFGFSSPLLTGNYFYGRQNIINDLIDSQRNNQMSGIFGLRKVGKTSILNAYMNRTNDEQSISVFIDCQDTSIYKRSWNELLNRISDLAAESFKNQFEEKIAIITNSFIDDNLDDDFSEKNASTTFEKNLEFLKTTFEVKNITLIFDEIEDISYGLSYEESWKDGTNYLPFWKTIRSIYQRKPNLFCIIVCGVNPHSLEIQEIHNTQNPLFSAIKVHWVPNFSENETIEMVNDISKYMGIKFKPSIITELFSQFGGHPFMIRQAGSKIHQILISEDKYRPFTVEKMYYNEKKDSILEANKNHTATIMKIFKERYPDEYEVLKYLAAGVHDKAKEKINENVNIITHLKNYNIVDEYDGRFSIKLQSISSFFDNREITGLQTGWEERNKEVFNILTPFEVNLRKFVKYHLIKNFGEKISKEKISKVLLEQRKPDFIDIPVDEILDSKKSKLYMSELMAIVENEWKVFGDIMNEEKTYLKLKFSQINKMRTHPGHNTESQLEDVDYKLYTNWILDYTQIFKENCS